MVFKQFFHLRHGASRRLLIVLILDMGLGGEVEGGRGKRGGGGGEGKTMVSEKKGSKRKFTKLNCSRVKQKTISTKI